MDLLTTATSADERERGSRIAVFPIGSFEQHGDHLPLITDTIVACTIAKAIADEYGLFLLPPPYNFLFTRTRDLRRHREYQRKHPVRVRAGCIDSLSNAGTPRLLVVNGHGGNYVLGNVVQELNQHQPVASLFPASLHWDRARQAAAISTSSHEDMHAGELESSILLEAAPSVLRNELSKDDHIANERPELLTLGMAGYTRSGVIGRPSLATAGKGQRAVKSLVLQASDIVATLAWEEPAVGGSDA